MLRSRSHLTSLISTGQTSKNQNKWRKTATERKQLKMSVKTEVSCVVCLLTRRTERLCCPNFLVASKLNIWLL